MIRNVPSRAVFQLVSSVALLALLWQLRSVVILVFGVVIVAAALVSIAQPLARLCGMRERYAVLCTLLGIVTVLALGIWALGDPLADQLQQLRDALPKAWHGLRESIGGNPLGARLVDAIDTLGGPRQKGAVGESVPWQRLASFAGAATGFVADVILIAVMGVYLALDPSLYQRGAVSLFPPAERPRVSDALNAAGYGLSRWLLGQGIAMLAMGIAATAGLALLGIPLAVALGFITGLLEFIPFFGPIAAGLMVDLPPVLGVLAVVLFGALFGVPGVVFGTPLMVVAMILIERLYVRRMEEEAPAADGAA